MGLKLTPQRLAIFQLLDGNSKHPSAEDIYKELKPNYPSLSLATVYNTLDVLTKAGELQELRIKSDKRNYDFNTTPHSHFLCRVCSSVYDMEAGLQERRLPSDVNGYLVEGITLNYYGVCPECLEMEKNK